MFLSDWARRSGVSYATARRMFARGDIPGAKRTAAGTILVDDEAHPETQLERIERKLDDVIHALWRLSNGTRQSDQG